MVERTLRARLAFMNGNGLLHFDAHFGNILTDGQRLHSADLGLATSPRFDLSAAESDFVGRHLSHDVCYALTQLVNWLVSNVCGVAAPATGGPVERNDYIRRCAAGAQVVDAPAAVAEMIRRYAPAAVVVNDFYWDLFGKSRATPYPAATSSAPWLPSPISRTSPRSGRCPGQVKRPALPEEARLKQMQSRPGLIDGFLADNRLDLTPF